MNNTKILEKVCVFLRIHIQGVIILQTKFCLYCCNVMNIIKKLGLFLSLFYQNNLQEDNFMFITETKVKEFALYEYSGHICILNL